MRNSAGIQTQTTRTRRLPRAHILCPHVIVSCGQRGPPARLAAAGPRRARRGPWRMPVGFGQGQHEFLLATMNPSPATEMVAAAPARACAFVETGDGQGHRAVNRHGHASRVTHWLHSSQNYVRPRGHSRLLARSANPSCGADKWVLLPRHLFCLIAQAEREALGCVVLDLVPALQAIDWPWCPPRAMGGMPDPHQFSTRYCPVGARAPRPPRAPPPANDRPPRRRRRQRGAWEWKSGVGQSGWHSGACSVARGRRKDAEERGTCNQGQVRIVRQGENRACGSPNSNYSMIEGG